MTGRLIENQKIGTLQDEDCQRNPSLLSPGQVLNPLEDVVPGESVRAKEIPGFTYSQLPRIDDRIQHRLFGSQVGVALSEVSYLYVGPHAHTALERRHLPQDRADERCLASPIRSQQRHGLSAPQGVILGREKGSVRVVPDHQIPQPDHQIPASSRFRQRETEWAVVAGLLDPLEPLQPLPSPLRLTAPLPGDVATDERLCSSDELLLLLVESLLTGHPGSLLLHVVAVIPPVLLQPPPGQLPHLGREPVKKCPVVRHNDHGPLPRCQVVLQPFHTGEIQVIGRLVQ